MIATFGNSSEMLPKVAVGEVDVIGDIFCFFLQFNHKRFSLLMN
ncbi:hypothetical protein [Gracilibacillus lacisalsi]|nr:hypothetical protein [Gracilibacillus lacisalsi]